MFTVSTDIGTGWWIRWELNLQAGGHECLGMISCALMTLGIKENQRLRCQETRQSVNCSKIWGILSGIWEPVSQSRDREGQQRKSRQWEARCWEGTCCCAKLLGCVWLFAPREIVARQAPLSMGILQARIVEWVATPSSRGSSQPRDWTQFSCIAGGFFTGCATRETQE